MENFSMSLTTREIKIKIAMRYHITIVRMDIIKKTETKQILMRSKSLNVKAPQFWPVSLNHNVLYQKQSTELGSDTAGPTRFHLYTQ